jgi:hypothetical protein
MAFSSLTDDCTLSLALCLDYKSVLSFSQLSRSHARICANPLIWQHLIHGRVGRTIHCRNPKLLFRKSLRAGSPRFVSPVDGRYWLHQCCRELGQRRDIVRSSMYPNYQLGMDVVACVTVDDRCLVHMHPWSNKHFHFQQDVGRAQDALVWSNLAYWYVALLNGKKLRLLRYEGSDMHAELPVLKKRKVKSLLAFDDLPNACCIVCLLEDNSVVSATCESNSRVKVLAENAYNPLVMGHDYVTWSTRSDDKYIRLLVQRSPGWQDIRAQLIGHKLRYAKYGDPVAYHKVHTKKKEWTAINTGERIPPPFDYDIDPRYKGTSRLVMQGHRNHIDDVWIMLCSRDIIVRSGRRILLNSNTNHKWKQLVNNVLWARSTRLDLCISMVVEPR